MKKLEQAEKIYAYKQAKKKETKNNKKNNKNIWLTEKS